MDRPGGWLYVTAFRLMRRRLAREARRPHPDPVPESVAAALADRVALQHALAALPVRQRQAVVARHVQPIGSARHLSGQWYRAVTGSRHSRKMSSGPTNE